MHRITPFTFCLIASLSTPTLLPAQPVKSGNNPAGVELFRDRGLGLFIHWGVDGALGGVISHSLVGASADFQRRYFTELAQFFNPQRYQPEEWASLAKLAGFKYVVFTTKHHSGFACGTQKPPTSA